MRLPVIKSINEFIQKNDEDFVLEAIEVLEEIAQSKGIKDNELDVIGELLSNMYGAIEVSKNIKNGEDPKEAVNNFMKRVLSSIDQ